MFVTCVKHRRFSAVLVFFLLFGIATCAAIEKGPLTDPQGWVINREFLSYDNNSNKKVELFWTKPSGDGPYAAVLLIHGHQIKVRDGGESYVKAGFLGKMVSQGYVTAVISLPGYGNSSGPPDYCGPFTQEAVLVAINFLRKQTFIKPDKLAIYGYSRGAIVASMVATRDQKLAAVVLGAGVYDFFKWYPTPDSIMNSNIKKEGGTSAEAFKSRSAIYHVENIKSPVLLLHGARDETIPVEQAEAFAEKLKANGIVFKMKIFPNAGHRIPNDELNREIDPFLEEFLR